VPVPSWLMTLHRVRPLPGTTRPSPPSARTPGPCGTVGSHCSSLCHSRAPVAIAWRQVERRTARISPRPRTRRSPRPPKPASEPRRPPPRRPPTRAGSNAIPTRVHPKVAITRPKRAFAANASPAPKARLPSSRSAPRSAQRTATVRGDSSAISLRGICTPAPRRPRSESARKVKSGSAATVRAGRSANRTAIVRKGNAANGTPTRRAGSAWASARDVVDAPNRAPT
jgi:hypothetical protein